MLLMRSGVLISLVSLEVLEKSKANTLLARAWRLDS
jgi:hypothetical protein